MYIAACGCVSTVRTLSRSLIANPGRSTWLQHSRSRLERSTPKIGSQPSQYDSAGIVITNWRALQLQISSTCRSDVRTVTTASGTQSSAQLTPHGGSSAEQMQSRNRSITICSISVTACCARASPFWSLADGITIAFSR